MQNINAVLFYDVLVELSKCTIQSMTTYICKRPPTTKRNIKTEKKHNNNSKLNAYAIKCTNQRKHLSINYVLTNQKQTDTNHIIITNIIVQQTIIYKRQSNVI